MEMNLADLFELVADEVAGTDAVVSPGRRLTYAGLDRRADRLAHHLGASGVRPGDRVGVQLANGTEYLEVMLACFKVRAVPVNVNYRYVTGELEYLYRDAGLVGLVYHRRFAPAVAPAVGALAERRVVLRVADGPEPDGGIGDGWPAGAPGDDYEEVLAGAPEGRDRSGPLGGGPLLRLHRRDHRDAQGRALAPRRHLLRRHGWGGPVRLREPHHPARGAGPADPAARGDRPGHPAVHARRRPLVGVLHLLRRWHGGHDP